ncbi:insulin-like growth factor-binding protein 6 [Zootoca vivipara]|uniref:insulin-like growth factor-binding protein 6 n=1 Tax=Zootoca vivipara TaxID=8524 RepID=UPI00293BD2EB|nr:insulin-like growth factor-binding protein 6 [Zootoca vivipara]
MLPACCLETALLLLLLTEAAAAGGRPGGGGAAEGHPSAACASAASVGGRASLDRDAQALCDEKGCDARALGESCGVYTPGCAPGLRCVPRPGERTPLHALLRGQGVCVAGGGGRNQTKAAPAAGDGWEENRHAGQSTAEPLLLQSQDPLQEVTVGKTQLQQLSLSSDTKQEHDMAPCRRHLAAILQELKAPLYQNGQDIFIPNCDTKGFYRRKQCQASKGQKRGQCWCVDKRGRRLEGMEEKPLCLLPNVD